MMCSMISTLSELRVTELANRQARQGVRPIACDPLSQVAVGFAQDELSSKADMFSTVGSVYFKTWYDSLVEYRAPHSFLSD